jgi:hypothetical protein
MDHQVDVKGPAKVGCLSCSKEFQAQIQAAAEKQTAKVAVWEAPSLRRRGLAASKSARLAEDWGSGRLPPDSDILHRTCNSEMTSRCYEALRLRIRRDSLMLGQRV